MAYGVIESISMSAFVEGALACLRYPFLGTFCIPNPLIFPFDTHLSFSSPLYKVSSFIPSFFYWAIILYNLVHSYIWTREITIRGGRAQVGLRILWWPLSFSNNIYV
jgi:hypothetical protein